MALLPWAVVLLGLNLAKLSKRIPWLPQVGLLTDRAPLRFNGLKAVPSHGDNPPPRRYTLGMGPSSYKKPQTRRLGRRRAGARKGQER